MKSLTKKITLTALLMGALLALAALPAAATPLAVAVDMDPSTPGIQSALTVSSPGTTFTVDVVTYDLAGGSIFDTTILQTSYNDLGMILGPGPTGPTWLPGGLASNSFLTTDLFSGASPPSLLPGAAGTAGPFPPPFPGFASNSPTVGLIDPLLFFVGPLPMTPIFSIDFTALAVGTSVIVAHGSPLFAPEFALGGVPVSTGGGFFAGAVTVTPEPATMLLLGTGLAGLAGAARRRKKK